jgi:hypothetical protein
MLNVLISCPLNGLQELGGPIEEPMPIQLKNTFLHKKFMRLDGTVTKFKVLILSQVTCFWTFVDWRLPQMNSAEFTVVDVAEIHVSWSRRKIK